MNVTELVQSFFGGEHATRLGQAAGLNAQTAQRVLGIGLPLQLDALADHAATPQGQSQLAEAIQNLPDFGSVAEALDGPEGATNLQRAGELLAPALLAGRAGGITDAVVAQSGAGPDGVGRLLRMALPLLISLLGRRGGLDAGNLGASLGGLRGSLTGLGGLLGAGAVAGAMSSGPAPSGSVAASPVPASPAGFTPETSAAGPPTADAPSPASVPASLTAPGLLDFLKGQFSGAAAEKIGAVAGFGGSTASRATQAALPLILNALVNRGRTEAGAAEVMGLSRQFSGLSDDAGRLNTNLLNDPAEMSRIEGQGRGLLGSMFGNLDELTGRLGTALGGSGSSAGRLLALLAPLVLSVLGGRARAGNLDAGGLSGLLGGVGGSLSGLLPVGLGSLAALLGTGGTATAPAPAAAPPRPAVPVAAAPPPASAAPAPGTAGRRGAFPWWLIPLLAVLLVGGCWILRPRPAATTDTGSGTAATGTTDPATTGTATTDPATTPGTAGGAVAAGGFMVSEPAADATLPAGGFTLRGMGKAGESLQILEDGTSLGNVTVGADGAWSLDVPSPAAGKHSYAVKGADGTELGTRAVTIGAAAAGASAVNCTDEYSLSITDGQTVSEPFRFGGKGQGRGYSVTVRRGERTIGTKDIPLDATCGWSYQSRPGAGSIRYEVRPLGEAGAAPLSTVNLTVSP